MGWGFVGRGFVGQPRIPDKLCTPRSHADGDLDLKLILLVFTSPGYDLLLHIYLKNKPLYFGFLWLCGQGTDAYLDISGSPKFSTHYLLWEVCGTPVFCQATAPFLSFHTRRDHMGALKAFCLKTDVRRIHVSAGRLPSHTHLLLLLRMSSLRQTLVGSGLQQRSKMSWGCKAVNKWNPLPVYPGCTFPRQCIIIVVYYSSSKDRNASLNTCIK